MTDDTATNRTGHTPGLARSTARGELQLCGDGHLAGRIPDVDPIALSAREIVDRITGSAAFQSSAMAFGELISKSPVHGAAGTDYFSADYREHGTYSI